MATRKITNKKAETTNEKADLTAGFDIKTTLILQRQQVLQQQQPLERPQVQLLRERRHQQ